MDIIGSVSDKLQEKIQKIESYRLSVYESEYKVGETIADETYAECYDLLGDNLLFLFRDCKTEKEYELVNKTLEAVCGYRIEAIIAKVHERDENHHKWSLLNCE